MSEVQLYIRGHIYGGWTDATVTKSLDAIYGEARLSLTRLFDEGPATVPSIRLDDDARLTVDGETVIVGYIKSRDLELDEDGFDFDVVIQDNTSRLVRGSVVNFPAEWKNQTALQIIENICKPFGISVSAQVPVGKPFEKFTAQPGDTAAKVIERVCRHRALMVYADSNSQLIVTTAKAATLLSDEIRLDADNGNALSLSLSEDIADRHNEYICHTQSPGSDWATSEHSKVTGRAKDHGISSYCPLVIIADEPGDAAAMTKLATTTAAINAARSESRDYLVSGLRGSNGKLWDINKKVPVNDSIDGLRATRLISKIVFSISDEKADETRLTVTHPDAYELVAEPETKPGEVWNAD